MSLAKAWLRSIFYNPITSNNDSDTGSQSQDARTSAASTVRRVDLGVINENADVGMARAENDDNQQLRQQEQAHEQELRSWVLKTGDLLNRALVEFTACMMFHFIGSVSPTAWTNGIVLMVLVYYTAKVSGAHLNPAVSLTFCLLGHTSPLETVVYWGAQVAGCAVGALWIAVLVPGMAVDGPPSGAYAGLSGCFVPAGMLTRFQIFAWEAVCTCCFIVPIFSVVWYTQNKKGYGNTGPLIVGLSLIANALACGQFTGASLNPARSVGSPIVFECPDEAHTDMYVAGEILGGIIATLAIIPWYGVSRTAWYAAAMPEWAFTAAKKNQKSIVIETIQEVDVAPTPGHAKWYAVEQSHMSTLSRMPTERSPFSVATLRTIDIHGTTTPRPSVQSAITTPRSTSAQNV